MLNDFYKSTTKKFDVIINYNGTAPNITSDTVTMILKTSKGSSTITLSKNADVFTSGGSGIAKFNLSKTDTSIPEGRYYYEIYWRTQSGEEYVLDEGEINILKRV